MSQTLVKSLTTKGDNGGWLAAGNTPHLTQGVRAGPDGDAGEAGVGGGGDRTGSLADVNIGKMFPSWSMSAILIGVEAEQVQISGPHEQILRWGVGRLGTLFPSLSLEAILFGSCAQLAPFLEHNDTQIKILDKSTHNFPGNVVENICELLNFSETSRG